MNKFKKGTALLLALILVLQLSSCRFYLNLAGGQSFDSFIDGLPSRFISSDDMNLNYLFNDPEQYGFEKKVLKMPINTEKDYKDTETFCNDLLKELKAYDYDALTIEQKMSYDVLEDYLNRQLLTVDFYDLDNSFLGSFIGFQAQLPLLLNEFSIGDKTALQSYFNILETSPDIFSKYADIEQKRQNKRVGMSKSIMKKVIEQCENFAKNDNSFLVESMNKKIDAADFLNDQEKKTAKEKNKTLVLKTLVDAYKALGEKLSKISVKTGDLGLCTMPRGKEYYEALLKQKTGIDTSVKDLKTYFQQKQKNIMKEFIKFIGEHPELNNITDATSVKYGDFKTAEENLDYLETQLPKDYPSLDNLKYKIIKVPDSMKDNFSPAAYLQSKVDKKESEPEAIYINGDYSQDIFTTIAHEGYPGHMYQNCYFHEQDLPAFRYMVDYNGYSEGWATYVEWNSWKYADVKDKAAVEYLRYNSILTACIYGLLDIAVHYEGISKTEFAAMVKQNFGDIAQESIDEIFDLILETPTNYLQYYLNGMYYQDLYDSAEKQLGEKFNSVEFNEVLLKTGPTDFNLLKEQVEKYIKNHKKENAASGVSVSPVFAQAAAINTACLPFFGTQAAFYLSYLNA